VLSSEMYFWSLVMVVGEMLDEVRELVSLSLLVGFVLALLLVHLVDMVVCEGLRKCSKMCLGCAKP
jgi:hypothetical protein